MTKLEEMLYLWLGLLLGFMLLIIAVIIYSKMRINNLMKKGYIAPHGRPLKCPHCGCTKFRRNKKRNWEVDYNSKKIVGFKLKCLRCGRIVAKYSWGIWEV